ncbi:ABC transporter ATP-binding protein [Sandaracinus amylolyticus]|uniref:ABC transporter ATP-binding protein n=1 Tax=Sandaracinus amylolyticus TaxID=927083 RepID=UPI001F3CF7F5|nr:ABC transporter ATP-binding protein [Sandaracinus amylolyticus]
MARKKPWWMTQEKRDLASFLRDRELLLAALRDSARTFGLVWSTHRPLGAALLALGALGAALPAAIAWTGHWIVDAIQRAVEHPEARREVLIAVGIELALVLASNAIKRVQTVVHGLLRALVAERANEMILEKALGLELVDFENPGFYDTLSQARSGASHYPLGHVMNVLSLGQSVLALFGLAALLIPLSPLAVLVLIAAAIPQFVVETRFSRDAFRLFRWRSEETRKQNYLETVLASSDHAKETKLFGLGDMLLEKYRAIFWKLWKEDRDLTIRRGLWGLAIGSLGTLAFYAIYAWIAWQAALGAISLADMTMYLLVFRQGQSTLGNVFSGASTLYEDVLYLTAFWEFLDHRDEDAPSGTATSGPDPLDGVRFQNVWYTYPGAKEPALRGVDLHLPPRRKLALVGENGAGKTTIIKLLTRLYRPSQGRITLDGLPLDEWDERALRRRMGVIFQDFVQYQWLVGENIGVGDVSAFDDEARWKEAAEKGSASDFVSSLPKGFHTQLGHWFDEGQELSLGQWQKIALSRAFMRRDADILVLDEPTASMDAEAEARIFARFRALTEQRTAVLISHRFSTVRMADRIAVIEGGVVTEHGSHDELMALGGRYARLFTLQAQGYR